MLGDSLLKSVSVKTRNAGNGQFAFFILQYSFYILAGGLRGKLLGCIGGRAAYRRNSNEKGRAFLPGLLVEF